MIAGLLPPPGQVSWLLLYIHFYFFNMDHFTYLLYTKGTAVKAAVSASVLHISVSELPFSER